MKKKIVAFMLTAVMSASLIGCSSGDSTETKKSAGDASADDTLTVWCWDPSFNIAAMEEAAKEAGVKVNVVETASEDCETKLTTAATSGDYGTLADIILLQDNAYQKYLSSYPDAFTALDDIDIDWSQFSELKQSYSMVDDKHYGVPFDNGAVIACYRTDILKEAGYTIKDLTDITWEQLITIGEDIYKKTGKYLLSGQADSPDTILMMMQSCGASLFNEDGSAYIDGNVALDKIVDIYTEMVQKHVYMEVNSWDDYVGTIAKENVAGTINGNWITGTIMSNKEQSGKWEITNMPIVDGVEGATHYSYNGGSSWYVSANCKNVALAEKLLGSTFGSSTEFYDTILSSTGAISTYAPAADSTKYQEKQEFWNNQAIFATIVDFSSKTPNNIKSPYHYEARSAVGTAIQAIIGGTAKADAFKDAQAELEFKMQE